MRKPRSPPEKKRLSLDRDHRDRERGRNDKAMRRVRPLAKAQAERAARRAERQRLVALEEDAPDDVVPVRCARGRGRWFLRVPSLRDFVAERLARRAARAG